MRQLLTEQLHVYGVFRTGDTVSITLYDMADNSLQILDDNACEEIASTGIFKWNVSELETAPKKLTEYLWIMTNGKYQAWGIKTMGGFPTTISWLRSLL